MNHIFINDDFKRGIAFWLVIVPSIVWGLVSWCYLFVHRLNHAGEVCSGDFLEPKEKHEGYLIDTGLMIIFIWRLCLLFVLVVGGFALFAFACAVHDKQTNVRTGTSISGREAFSRLNADLLYFYGIAWAIFSVASVIVITCLMLQDFSILFH